MTLGFPDEVIAGPNSRTVRISSNLETLYLSDWYFEELRAAKILGADCSLNDAYAYIRESQLSL